MYRKWLENAVFYEIYPQSFMDSNGDGIGDFEGITEKLDYISSLGCNAIWMNPCFESPFGDAGYDVTDYYRAAPRYGTNEDLVRLFKEVHRRGMHILLDLVPGHTSTECEWYKKSCLACKNEYTDRYVWTSSVWEEPKDPPMNLLRGHSERDGASVLNFFSFQPALNYGFYKPSAPWQQSVDDPGPRATAEAILDVMRFWLGLGADGFRVDMAFSLVKNDEEEKGTIALWQRLFSVIRREYPDAAFIAEWGNPARAIEAGFDMDFLLHSVDYYVDMFHREAPFFSESGGRSAEAFAKGFKLQYEKVAGHGFVCIPSGNHDMERMARYCSPEEMKLAFAFLLTMPGCPYIYYGDEIGMRYMEGLVSKEGGYYRTGARTPMQWTAGKNAGFSAADPEKLYLPVDESPDRPDVASQDADPHSLLNTVRSLTALRRSHSCLQSAASVEFLRADDILVYRRTDAAESIIVIIAPGSEKKTVAAAGGEILFAIGGVSRAGGDGLNMSGVSCAVIKQ